MTDRLDLYACSLPTDLTNIVVSEIKMMMLGDKVFPLPKANHDPLHNCIAMVAASGATAVVIQRRVFDPDFNAEYAAYYGQLFSEVSRTCTRVHFFANDAVAGEDPLAFLDRVPADSYLGFLTLRPVARASVGATIFDGRVASPHVVCSRDRFPVHIAGKTFEVDGTPFMQQDNAVAVCAQASIWVALRTMRKREGDRAHNPAQITDAATKYFVVDRTRPNKGGLTMQQMAEAVRATGYSPLSVRLKHQPSKPDELLQALVKLHAYVESDIPVLLPLNAPSGGHAVAAIGHTWTDRPAPGDMIFIPHHQYGMTLKFCHAASWAPQLLVHNDNTGPYQILPTTPAAPYSLSQVNIAIPLLPSDVFMTGEEALANAIEVLGLLVGGLNNVKTVPEIEAIAQSLVVRLLLADKSRLREWAANTAMAPELSRWLRKEDLPRRVWVLEVHLKKDYGDRHAGFQNTMVGLVLIDPTGDAADSNAVIMAHLDCFAIAGVNQAAMLCGKPAALAPVTSHSPVQPLRR